MNYKCRAELTLMVILAGVLLAAPASAQQRARELDDREVVKLAETLSSAGMAELLEELIDSREDLRGKPAGWALEGELRIAEANRVGYSDEEQQSRRGELLEEAAELFARAADATARATSDTGKLNHFRYRLKRIDVLGRKIPQPELVRLMYLRGGKPDRSRAYQQTEDSVDLMEDCLLDLEDTLQQWRSDLVKLATVMPELESIHRSALYQAAWVRFYRGMVLPADQGQRRQRLLGETIEDALRFVQSRRGNGRKGRAMLAAGMAARETGDYADAREFLEEADTRSASPALRMQAKFQKARTAVESADGPDAGEAAVETFRDELSDILGAGSELQIDLHATMLRDHLYRTLARSARQRDNTEQAEEYARKAQLALLGFLEEHGEGGVESAFLDLVVRRYAESEYEDSPLILLARAGQAPPREGQELLEQLISRQGEIADRLRRSAIWRLGLLHSRNQRYRQAAEEFLRLAEEYPDHELAIDAARNAAAAFSKLLSQVENSGERPTTELRREFVDILRFVTEKWPRRRQTARWNFELGWQLQQLAAKTDEPLDMLTKAAEAYEGVPQDVEESLEARFLALRLRVRVLRESDWSDHESRRRAEELVEELRDYAEVASAELDSSADRQDDLARWGVEADFDAAQLEYEVLDRKASALESIRKLPEKWPGGETLRAAAEFEVRKLVESGRTEEAIDRVDEFRRQYPEQAEDLMHLVAWQVRERLRELARQPDTSQQRSALQEAFLEFTSDLYERGEGQSDADRYPYMQMYAEALLANGDAERALGLFRRCRDIDEQRRSEDPDRAIDATNIRGLAAAHQALGNYEQAAKLYGELVSAMEPDDTMYWRTELEYCRSLLEARREDPESMRRLILRIRQIRAEDRQMGGFYARFDEIEADASNAMRR
ncbi:MAG: tetratricopeptide repeat protein [Phycisphaerae bacterium]